MPANVAFGLTGPVLSDEERDFFAAAKPYGFILFARNCRSRAQMQELCAALRACANDASAPIFIDQEGGRVARMRPPEWRARPPAARFGALFAEDAEAAREAVYLNARLIAHDLREVGVTVDCAPVLDLPAPDADAVIGDRAFAADPTAVIELGRAMIDGLLEGGVLPVIKHIPGHGRARVDSHHELPRIGAPAEALSAHDFVPFRSLNHAPIAMTAHVVIEAIDPQRPATTSPKIVRDVIRGEIGFAGLLVSDDIGMQALSGSFAARTRAAHFAGCDLVLHCSGRMDEMKEVAGAAKPLEGQALKRAQGALAHLRAPGPFDPQAAEARLSELLGGVA